jgi:hypothetical protein
MFRGRREERREERREFGIGGTAEHYQMRQKLVSMIRSPRSPNGGSAWRTPTGWRSSRARTPPWSWRSRSPSTRWRTPGADRSGHDRIAHPPRAGRDAGQAQPGAPPRRLAGGGGAPRRVPSAAAGAARPGATTRVAVTGGVIVVVLIPVPRLRPRPPGGIRESPDSRTVDRRQARYWLAGIGHARPRPRMRRARPTRRA